MALKKTISKSFLLSFLPFLFFTGCGTSPKKVEVPPRPVIHGVKVQIVKGKKIPDYDQAVGTIKSKKTAELSSKIMGQILAVEAEQGESVHQGEPLIFISSRSIRKKEEEAFDHYKQAVWALKEAEQEKKLAHVTWKRYRNLFIQKAISPQESDEIAVKKNIANLNLLQAEAEVKMAESNLEQTKVMLSDAEIDAPFSGIVVKKIAHVGDMAVPGMPLLTLEDDSEYFLKAHLNENLLPVLKKGMKILVKIPSLSKTLNGKIVRIDPVVSPETRTFEVKIALKGESLSSGLYAEAEIPVSEKKVILVPKKALVRKGDLIGVYAVNQKGIVSYRLIRTGEKKGIFVEIVSGLHPGNLIIVKGLKQVIDGGILSPFPLSNNSRETLHSEPLTHPHYPAVTSGEKQ